MTDYQSVYNNHYGGETYRFGVAYLRQEQEDYEPAFYAGRYPSLEEQREIIADLSIKAQTIVIAEFIDNCGPIAVEDRLGLFRLLEFWRETHPQVMFAATQDVLSFNTEENFAVKAKLELDECPVITTDH